MSTLTGIYERPAAETSLITPSPLELNVPTGIISYLLPSGVDPFISV